MTDNVLTPEKTSEDREGTLRPRSLVEFVGQGKIKKSLRTAIDAAKLRKETLDHVLFYGPPGTGKTTLSTIIAKEMGSSIKITSGPMITKPGTLGNILTNIRPNSVLFIDEAHRLTPAVEECLYSAMEDFTMDVMLGDGADAISTRVSVPKFTLIASTTRTGMLSAPFRDRFGLHVGVDLYEVADLMTIVTRSAHLLHVPLNDAGAMAIARRARGTPRIANRLLKRVRDYAAVNAKKVVDEYVVASAMADLDVDDLGLDGVDRRLLTRLLTGPAGLASLASTLGEDQETIMSVHEPYLVRTGLIVRTPSGRAITEAGREHLKNVGGTA